MNENTQLDIAQQILLQLRETFLEELPDRCDDIEDGILALGKDEENEHFQRLYREVHSLKGSAGTHGVQPISTICHQLEDNLSDAQENASHTPERIDIYLLYLDLIRRCHSLAQESPPNYAEIDQALEDIRHRRAPNTLSALVVENSQYMANLYQHALKDQPVQVTVEDDGLEALGRLLREKFDVLIMGAETRTLNGTALLYALRAANGINRHTKVIVVTSNQQHEFIPDLRPDLVVPRGPGMIPALSAAVAEFAQQAEY